MKKNVQLALKLVLTLCLVLTSFATLKAQIAMTRTTFSGAFTPITGTAATAAQGDDVIQTAIPIGFTFNYLGTGYTNMAVCSNGWASFTATASSAANGSLGTTAVPNATLAPWWDDLSSSSVQYTTTGTPGTQVFTIQWTSLSYYTASTRTINYQLKLYEGTNEIEFWYGSVSGTGANGYIAESASIGIENATGGPGNFINATSGSSYVYNGTQNSGQWPTQNYRFTPTTPSAIAAGTYNVGTGQTYTTLTEAVADINHRGIAGAVTLNLTDLTYTDRTAGGNETFPIVFGPVVGTSAANTLTLQGNGADLRYAGSVAGSWGNGSAAGTMFATTAEPIMGVCGTDYLTVNNVKLTAITGLAFGTNTGNPTRVDRGLAVQNCAGATVAVVGTSSGAQNNTFSNITITLDRTNTNTIAIDQGNSTAPTAATGANSGNKYYDLTIRNSHKGILFGGNATYPDIGGEIGTTSCSIYNSIGNPSVPNDLGLSTSALATYGIQVSNQSGIKIFNNIVRNITNNGGQLDGISVLTFQGTSEVYNNKIQTLRNGGTASVTLVSGIRATHTVTGTHTLRVYNNIISEILSGYTGAATATRVLKGIFIAGTGGLATQQYEVSNNSVSLDGSASPNVSSTCFENATTSGPVFSLRNNIFANFTGAQTGVANHMCLFSTSATAFGNTGTISDYNDLYIANSTNGYTGVGSTTTYSTRAAWSAAVAGMEANSVEFDPIFGNNVSDLHSASASLNNAGTAAFAYVTQDLDCAARTDNDMGAYNINSCTVVVGGTISPSTVTRCAGQIHSISAVGATLPAIGLSYQWEVSTTGGGVGFAPVSGGSGANTISYTTAALTAGTFYYRLAVTCSSGPTTSYSNEQTVSVNPAPSVSVTSSGSLYCIPGGVAITLDATGGSSTYSWLPSAGLSATNTASVTATPSSTTTYTVTGTDANGCTNTSTAAISAAAYPVNVTATATPNAVCAGGVSSLSATGDINVTANVGVANATIGGTTGNPYRSGNGVGNQIKTQMLYTAAELSAAGVVAGPITGIAFTGSGTQSGTVINFEIKIGHSLATALTTTFETTPLTSVFTQASFTPQTGLNLHTFNAGTFNWDGTSNLLIETCQTNSIIGTATVSTFTTATTRNNHASGSATACTALTGATAASVPIIQVIQYVPVSFSWDLPSSVVSPLTQTTATQPIASTTTYTVTATNSGCSITASTTVSVSPLTCNPPSITGATCDNTNFTVTAQPVNGGAPYSYAWSDGTNTYSNSATITPNLAAGTYTITCTITDNCAGVCTSSVIVTVNPNPTVTINGGSICNPGGTAVSLTANGATSYTYSPTIGLTPSFGSPVSANPSVSTIYTVTGTDGNGCTSTSTAFVGVGGVVTISTSSATPSTLCAGETSVLTANAATAAGTYCTANATATAVTDNIANVTFAGINNNSPGWPGAATSNPAAINLYGNYLAVTGSVTAGSTYPISVISFHDGSYYGTFTTAHFDWNQDGDFADAGETYSVGASVAAGTPINGSIAVPAAATNGNTRMRIVMFEGGSAANPYCGTFTYGEVEDYTITVSGGIDPMLYSWAPTASFVSSTGPSVTTNPINATSTYTVTATSGAGCTATTAVTVSLKPALTGTADATPSSICIGSSTVLNGNVPNVCSGSDATFAGTYAPATWTFSNGGGTGSVNTAGAPASIQLLTGNNGGLGTTFASYSHNVVCAGTMSFNWATSASANNIAVLSYPQYRINSGSWTTLNGFNTGGASVAQSGTQTIAAAAGDIIEISAQTLTGDAADAYTLTLSNFSAPTLPASGFVDFWDAPTGGTLLGTPPYTATPGSVGTATYYAQFNTSTSTGCTNPVRTPVVVTVNALPSVTATATPAAICLGSSSTLTGGGASTYLWDGTNPDPYTVSPTSNTSYTVTGTDGNGCSATSSVTVTVNALPVITSLTATPNPICPNGTSTLAVLPGLAGAMSYCNSNFTSVTYEFLTNVTFAGINNTSAGTIGGPVNYTAQTASVTAGVASTLSVTMDPDANDYIYAWIDWNQNGTLNDAGETYTLASNSSLAGPHTLSITPPVTALNGNTRMRVMVDWNNATPNPCRSATWGEAEDYTVSVSGGVAPPPAFASITWSPATFLNATNTATVTASAVTATTAYTVQGTDANGCSVTSSVTLTMTPAPTGNTFADPIVSTLPVSTTGNNLATNCWSSTYTGTNAQASPDVFYQFVMPSCNDSIVVSTCGSGWDTYLHLLDNTGTQIAFSDDDCAAASLINFTGLTPGATYYVVVEGFGSNTGTYNLAINSYQSSTLVVAGVSASPNPACENATVTLTGTGAGVGGSYTYTGPATITAGQFTATLAAAGTYQVTATTAAGCTATATTSVVVNALPAVTASVSASPICLGASTTFTGGGATSYTWTDGTNTPTDAVAFTPTTASVSTYTVTGTDANGCSNTSTVGLTVNALPTVTASATPSTTCNNSTVTPMGGGASTYAWSGGLTDNTPFVATTGTTTYTVTGTDGIGCTATSTVSVTVNAASGTLAPSTSNQAQNQADDFNLSYYDPSCNLIATVDDGAGGNILGLTTATVNVDANAGVHNGQPFVRRWYQITPSNNVGVSAIVTLYIDQADFTNYNNIVASPYLPMPTSGNNSDPNITNIRITKNSDAGLGNTPEVITPTTINWNGNYWELTFPVTGFSQFRVHSANPGNTPLPATITKFNGRKLNSSDMLEWTTASEQNNAYFNLQHSTNGVDFKTIAMVNSKAQNGNSQTELNYNYEHTTPSLGHNYYRLEQVDIDNQSTINAKIVDLIWGANGNTVSMYPNPTQDVLNIDLYTSKVQNTTVKVLDMSGRVVKQIQARSEAGMSTLSISLGELASGVYTVQVYDNDKLSHVGKVKKN